MTLIHNDEIIEWIEKNRTKPVHVPVPELFKCPKSDTCVMDCYHKEPHAYEEKYCNGLDGYCHTKCVHVLWSDITFFKEDFEIE